MDLAASYEIDMDVGDPADFVVVGDKLASKSKLFRSTKTIQDLVYDAGKERTTIFNGRIVSNQ
jgi:hypothetical protein